MNILPFANEQQTAPVDRATLFPQSTRPVVDDDKLKQLDELLKANLDVDVSRARKRRKPSSSAEGQSTLHKVLQPAPFRLISVANDPKVISLEPKPLPVRALWEPPCEDDDREAELRRQQALSAAVDIPSLLRSTQAYISRPQKAGKVIRASALLSSSRPPFFLAEMPHSKPVSLRLLHDCITRPSPHEVKWKGDALPIISLNLQKSEQPVARHRRKRRQRTVEKPPVAFWRPLRRWGGKSSGYAMGYEGSWPVEHEHELREKRYVRDKMRKAVHKYNLCIELLDRGIEMGSPFEQVMDELPQDTAEGFRMSYSPRGMPGAPWSVEVKAALGQHGRGQQSKRKEPQSLFF